MKGGLRARYRALTASRVSKCSKERSAIAGYSHTQGFTIVEVMIVLAITGALFLSAAVMISGRTAKTQFEQAINQISGQVRQQINDVSSGFYPNTGNFRCQASIAGDDINITSGANEQGTNSGCVFLGKALYFGVANTDPEQYVAFPIAALQRDSDGNEITSMAAAKPAVIYPVAPHPDAPDSTTSIPLQYGLEVSKMYYNSESNPIAAVAFVSSLGTYNGSELVSGSQQVSLVPITGTALNKSVASAATDINSNLVASNALAGPADGVSICFDSGTTDQSGLIKIGGGNGRQLSVTLSIKGNKGC